MTNPHHLHCRPATRGFALVVTLSLMILLTVIAVGLLSLSSVSLRQSRASMDMAEAQANARLSLMLAIGQLQKQMGPDTRISAAADQLPGATPETSSSSATHRQWTGVYDAWTAPASASSQDPRPTPVFREWLVSGNASDLKNRNFATAPDSGMKEMVGLGTLSSDGSAGRVTVPLLERQSNGKAESRLAWWVGDQGMKAALSVTRAPVPGALASVRAGLQGAPRNAVQLAKTPSGVTPFDKLVDDDARLALVSDFNQMGLLTADPKAPKPLFHDLTSHSSGLLTNVRSGGFRKDLSMYLEKSTPPTGGFTLGQGALYQVNGVDGIRDTELWAYYNLYKQLKTGNITFTTGNTGGGVNNPYLQAEDTDVKAQADYWFYYKRPVIIGYKALFSFYVVPASGSAPTPRLALCVDPVITFWNPYDVPVSLDPAFNTIRFEKIPYQINDLKVTTSAGTTNVPLLNLGGGANSFMNQANYVIMYTGNSKATGGVPIVLKPGEVLLYSQGANTTPLQGSTATGSFVYGKKGYNFGGGIYYVLKDSLGAPIQVPGGSAQVEYASITPTKSRITSSQTTSPISVNHFETYLFDDRTVAGSPNLTGMTLGIGGAFVDFFRGLPPPYQTDKPPADRFTADQKGGVYKSMPRGQFTIPATGTVNDRKRWFLYCSYDIKSEEDALRPGQYMSRLNPSAPLVDFADLSDAELDIMPLEIRIEPNSNGSSVNVPIGLDCDADGHGFIGGGLTSGSGSIFISTHSVPSEPLVSLASLQHSQANGFTHDTPALTAPFYSHPFGGKMLNNLSIRLPMLPQISHAIGNSIAPSILAPEKTDGSLTGRPLADHSYLANKALWDDWFFSGIAPRPSANQTQYQVADNFLNDTVPLPVTRYRPAVGSETTSAALARLFSGNLPQTQATNLAASMIRVDGLFNVNSTSVQAWKTVLGGLKNHPVATRAANGSQTKTANTLTPVTGLLAPTAGVSNGASIDVKDLDQWTGRRTLEDAEIEALAKKIVEEVRKRGPFLSLADFINRRPGTDKDLARVGAVQSAIDASEINKGFSARMATASASLLFPEAETLSPAAQSIAGVIKQGDILTPISPILSARSDSFIIRGYGEKLDSTGTRVLARAYCEAVVERDREFVDPADRPEIPTASLRETNKQFGRRFMIRSFRWLSPNEV